MDKIVKGIKTIVKEEIKSCETSLLAEICFMVEQLQVEIQQEVKHFHTEAKESISKLTETVDLTNSEITKLTTHMERMNMENKDKFKSTERANSTLDEPLENRSNSKARNIKEVQRILGLAGWYHQFVPDFFKVAQPLNGLKNKGRSFVWSPECMHAFNQLKV